MDRAFPYLSPMYTVTVLSESGHAATFDQLSRTRAASMIAFAKLMDHGYTVTYHGSTLTKSYPVEVCYGCQARPALWDMDCDGPYATSECGKCDWWAAVEARDAAEERCAAGEARVQERKALADLLAIQPTLFSRPA